MIFAQFKRIKSTSAPISPYSEYRRLYITTNQLTTSNISKHLKKLEYHVKETLISANVFQKNLQPACKTSIGGVSGLGFLDPCSVSDLEYEFSASVAADKCFYPKKNKKNKTSAIYYQQSFLVIDEEKQIETMRSVKHNKNEWYNEPHNTFGKESSASVSKILDLASEKGATCWLSSLPLQRYDCMLNKRQFYGSICMRYPI